MCQSQATALHPELHFQVSSNFLAENAYREESIIWSVGMSVCQSSLALLVTHSEMLWRGRMGFSATTPYFVR